MTIDSSSPIVLVGPEGLSRIVSTLGLKPRRKAVPRLEVPAGPIARYGLRLGKVLEQIAKAIGPVILEELEGIVESTPAGLVVRQDVGELLAARAQSLEIVAGGRRPWQISSEGLPTISQKRPREIKIGSSKRSWASGLSKQSPGCSLSLTSSSGKTPD